MTVGELLNGINTQITTVTAGAGKAINALDKIGDAAGETTGYIMLGRVLDSIGDRIEKVLADSLEFEKRNASLQSSMGLTAKAAANLAAKLDPLAVTYGMMGSDIRKYAGTIKTMLPTLKQAQAAENERYKGMIKTNHILQTTLGLTEEQSIKYTQYSQQFGKNGTEMLKAAENIAKAIDPSGDAGSYKMIIEEISNSSEDLLLQYGKIPGSLEAAVIKAKKFGFSLEQLKSTSEGLLDIESSIGSELEYQLLTGRRLIGDEQAQADLQGKSLTNAFREAALQGDMAKQADVMNQIIEQEGETLENNLFARKQMSQLLGVDEQQLASAIQKKKILEKAALKGVTIDLDGTDALAQAARAVEKGAITDEDFKSFAEANDTRTTEDLLKESIDVQKAMFALDTLKAQGELIPAARKQMLAAGQYAPAGMARGDIAAAGGLGIKYEIFNQALEASTDLIAAVKNSAVMQVATQARDAVSFPGYGKRTLITKEGALAFKDNDLIVAGTSLFGRSAGGNDTAMMIKAFVDAINNQTKQLTNGSFTGMNAPYYG